MPEPVILVHGGAGTLAPDRLTQQRRQAIVAGLRAALREGQHELRRGRTAMAAVVAAVSVLEDDPNFNAGCGAVFTSAGTLEMDAAVMDGATLRVGAVAGVLGPRNPVQAARLVLECSPHVLLAGAAALDFLRAQGIPLERSEYFATDERRAALERLNARCANSADDFDRHGTVGAVALDAEGNLAAATSTGGMTGKLPGRIGDTPLPGAGTWADSHCAVSATGHGESFIRVAAAHELSARLRLAGQDLQTAAAGILAGVEAMGGDGGLIALDRDGNSVLPFNTRGMYRGRATVGGPAQVAIYTEPLS